MSDDESRGRNSVKSSKAVILETPVGRQAEEYFDTGEVQNRVLRFGGEGPILLFVPGWASTEFTWRNFIPTLASSYRVHYFESREKARTKRKEDVDLSFDAMCRDLLTYTVTLSEPYILVGASTGSSMILKISAKLKSHCERCVLICPNLRFRMPRGFGLVRLAPSWVLRLSRPLVLWAIRYFSYGADGERVAGTLKAFSATDADILRRSATCLAIVTLSPDLATSVSCPTLLIYSKVDGVHCSEDADQIYAHLDQGDIRAVATFSAAHSRKCAMLIKDWLEE